MPASRLKTRRTAATRVDAVRWALGDMKAEAMENRRLVAEHFIGRLGLVEETKPKNEFLISMIGLKVLPAVVFLKVVAGAKNLLKSIAFNLQ